MQSIRENKPLFYAFCVSFGFFFVLALEIIPPLNRWMQLVPFPSQKVRLCARCLRSSLNSSFWGSPCWTGCWRSCATER